MKDRLVILNISQFIWTMGNGKGIPSVYEIQKEFVKSGHDVHFVIPKGNPAVPGVLNTDIEGFHIHKFWLPLSIIWSISLLQQKLNKKNKILKTLLGLIRFMLTYLSYYTFGFVKSLYISIKIKPHVVYSHTYFFTPLSYFISKLFNIPSICRLYGIGCYEAVMSKNSIKMIKNFPEIIALKMPIDMFIITNDGTRGDKVAKYFGVPECKVKFWINGVDKTIYNDKIDRSYIINKFNLSITTKILLMVSRLEKWKHVDRAIKMMPNIISKNDVTLVIIGDGPEKNGLIELTHKLKIEANIIFTGAITHNEVSNYMNCCDIFISLNDLTNFSNSVLEAMVCGKCIVALNVGGTSDLIVDNFNGILVNYDNLDNFANVIINLLNDENLRKYISNNALTTSNNKLKTWTERGLLEVGLIETLVNNQYSEHKKEIVAYE